MEFKNTKFYKEYFVPVFIIPFQGTFDHFVTKFFLGLGFMLSYVTALQDGTIQEVEILGHMIAILPVKFLVALNLLILANFTVGSLKALWGSFRVFWHKFRYGEKLQGIETFQFSKWDRSIYKLLAYNAGGFFLAVVMSIFPDVWSYIQYAYYLVFTGKEVHIGLRNLGLLSAITSVVEFVKKKGPDISASDILGEFQEDENG